MERAGTSPTPPTQAAGAAAASATAATPRPASSRQPMGAGAALSTPMRSFRVAQSRPSGRERAARCGACRKGEGAAERRGGGGNMAAAREKGKAVGKAGKRGESTSPFVLGSIVRIFMKNFL